MWICDRNRAEELYHLVSLCGFNAAALHLCMALNGFHETHWTRIHVLIYPFMRGAWIKGARDGCSVDMSHRRRQHHGFESVLWPLWMSAPERRSIPSLTTSKRLIKPKWFKNNDDKYLRMAVLHGLVALRGLQRLNLQKDFKQRSPPSVSPLPFSSPVMMWFGHEAWSGVCKRFIIRHKLMKMILTDSQTTYRTLISRI